MGIAGIWKNELDSKMTPVDDGEGRLSGTYLSSKAGNDKQTEPLTGLYRATTYGNGCYIGWIVCYSSTEEPDTDPAVCAWSGRYSIQNGQEVIETTCLLTVPSEEIANWDNTLVGKDRLTKTDDQ